MSKELDIELLQKKVLELTQKNKLLKDAVVYYADPLRKWDKGKVAQDTIKKLTRGYKPVNFELSYMMKEKEVYPFVEFQNTVEVYGQEPIEDE